MKGNDGFKTFFVSKGFCENHSNRNNASFLCFIIVIARDARSWLEKSWRKNLKGGTKG
jgi:hypothetical protein